MDLYQYQARLYAKIIQAFKTNNRALLYALCGCGKTVIALTLAKEMIRQGKRVAVSTYSMRDIRSQWLDEIEGKFPELLPHRQVVCSVAEAARYSSEGIPAVSNGGISKSKALTIFIPQTIRNNGINMGKFDLIIIDEAHEYLEVTNGQGEPGLLKKILKKHSVPTTKYLGLTGTGYELLQKGKFFEHSGLIIYDLLDGLEDKAVNNCAIYGEYFDFELSGDCYKSNKELNTSGVKRFKSAFKGLSKKGKSILKHSATATVKLTKILDGIKGKTLVIVPRGTGHEEALANFICVTKKNRLAAVVKTSKIDRQIAEDNEKMFRSKTSKTDFMVVIDMCSTGWDFPGLNNVIDLTFTRNPKSIIQRLARTIRVEHDKPMSKYIYCTDQSRSKNRVIYDLGYAQRMTTKLGIIGSAGGMVDSGIPEFLLMKKCYKDKKNGKKDSIEVMALDEFMRCRKETLVCKTLRQIQAEKGPWYHLCGDIVHEMHNRGKTHQEIATFLDLVGGQKMSMEVPLNWVRNSMPLIYKKLFQGKSVKTVLQERDLC